MEVVDGLPQVAIVPGGGLAFDPSDRLYVVGGDGAGSESASALDPVVRTVGDGAAKVFTQEHPFGQSATVIIFDTSTGRDIDVHDTAVIDNPPTRNPDSVVLDFTLLTAPTTDQYTLVVKE